jgi:hypothetical protein
MQLKVAAPPPSDQDFKIIYNGEEFAVSKFKMALVSPKFRKISNFTESPSVAVTGLAPTAVFGLFVRAIHGARLNITPENAVHLMVLSDEWGVNSVKSECTTFLTSHGELEEVLTQIPKSASPAFESVISSRLDAALQIPSLANFPLDTLTRILNHKSRILNNHHLLQKFILSLLDRYKSDASVLVSALDIRQLSAEEALQVLEHPQLTKTSAVESTVTLIKESAALKAQLEENKVILSQVLSRLEKLEAGTADSIKKMEDRITTTTSRRGSGSASEKKSARRTPELEEKPKKEGKRTAKEVTPTFTKKITLVKPKESLVEDVPFDVLESI